ncbi:FAD-binding and (Fe-S)-binding domain-containing protein [Pseudactinotalea suaedae]|uniref:FAD-binding and (Fe-S)-binding domain-containing protein n=1 Tax=Pseudactinotalea suaedae TaxID=1524924 RepID=UPI001F4F5603|nr:FAD-binding and (Fe-S)-binding domain-containing protein [Pseudactinotalea suaedae]
MPDLLADLRAAVDGEVDASTRRRAEYSSDASNYRVVPEVVVFPRSTEAVLATLEVARAHGSPITSRGGGTSVAGNAVGPGVVIDFSRHLNQVLEIDPDARTARVQPGTVMSTLQAAAKPYGLRFGPDPSTQNRCTIAGMIGNNACGPHAVAYGRTADNTRSLDVVDGTGRRFTAARGDLSPIPGLADLVTANLATIRTEFGRFERQVSGYSLEHLLPENGSDLAKFLVGTEGTLVTVLEATVDLVPIPGSPTIVALGYPDMPTAADAVPTMLAHRPLAIEGLDDRLLDVVRRHSTAPIPDLPEGAGWLLVEVGGADQDEAYANAEALVKDAGTTAVRILPAGPEAARIWQIRADGAGLAGRTPSGEQAWPGWEDAAVPPERLGTYLREFNALLDRYGVDGLPYGHFGDGCIHVRIDLPLDRPGGAGVLRDFMHEAAALVAGHGGSLSGEHGDGRARSELLPYMYTPTSIGLLEQVKGLFDPADLLNPGVVVRPQGVAQNLRRPHARPLPLARGGFAFDHDGGDLTTAVHRCVGVGKCRVDSADGAGTFMCPSFRATADEKDSTRGRARVLQELANGSLVQGWDSREVEESLDLCLSCKACGSDCPAGVDMATYKSEVLHQRYRGKLRPIRHYALGWLPRWSRLVTAVPGVAALANAALRFGPLRKLVLAGGGMDTRRGVPAFATERFTRWFRRQRQPAATQQREVLLWVDSFSETMSTAGAEATVTLLQEAGYTVRVPDQAACCGLTWISTGQLDGARTQLRRTLDVLSPWVERGVPVIGVEPSCTAVLRSDLLELLGDDPRAAALAAGVHTLAELLSAPAPLGPGEDWQPSDLSGVEVLAQPHCHHHAVMGYGTDLALLERAGAHVTTISGCCGLAGNFGMEKGHYDVSVAVAENGMLSALRAASEGAVLLADGFSCRTQADQLAGVTGVTLAELLTSSARPRVRS